MAMREGHIAAAAPAALMYGWSAIEAAAPWSIEGLVVGASAAISVMSVCTAPDWDHPRYEGRMHFFAALSRAYARRAYRIRLPKDRARERRDLHRGPTHCLETAALVGLLMFGLMSISEWTRPHALLIGLGVTIGWADHILLDALTPSGVPLSAIYSAIVHKEVWRRTTVSRRWKTLPLSPVAAAVMPRKTVVDGRRVKFIPVPCLLPGDERAPSSCDKGWFKTDKGAEHAIVIPGLYALTVLLGLARAGIIGLVFGALTGLA